MLHQNWNSTAFNDDFDIVLGEFGKDVSSELSSSVIGITLREEGGIEDVNFSSYLTKESVAGVTGRRKGNLQSSLISSSQGDPDLGASAAPSAGKCGCLAGVASNFHGQEFDADVMEDDAGGGAFIRFFTVEILVVFEGEWQWRRRGIVNP
ncbi:hypothetical protein SLEP1_g5961 [Rubroshorea leprosula]|uniref:Uncharacterized protein n=1 Tax=Rubroshorea leprosula TaxID=152421 RepID=A0AAV5HTM8_9ROSI|nr:hypothetical protein SLEP1_g5961 [Rubroshorea leprosula]